MYKEDTLSLTIRLMRITACILQLVVSTCHSVGLTKSGNCDGFRRHKSAKIYGYITSNDLKRRFKFCTTVEEA